jgi:hypothetical protein
MLQPLVKSSVSEKSNNPLRPSNLREPREKHPDIMDDVKVTTVSEYAGEKSHLGDRDRETDVDQEQVTMASFAHLDEKKILRKVCHFVSTGDISEVLTSYFQMDIRLIPMLALLYLLSFLDRKPSTSEPQIVV